MQIQIALKSAASYVPGDHWNSLDILLQIWFNTLMHMVNENSGGQHPAGFLLTGMRARRMAHRGDSHPAKRAMHSERKPFCVRSPFVHLESLVTCKIKHVVHAFCTRFHHPPVAELKLKLLS